MGGKKPKVRCGLFTQRDILPGDVIEWSVAVKMNHLDLFATTIAAGKDTVVEVKDWSVKTTNRSFSFSELRGEEPNVNCRIFPGGKNYAAPRENLILKFFGIEGRP